MRTFLRAAQLIDATGAPPLRDPLVMISGEQITYAGRATGAAPEPAPGDTVIDVPDGTILPGFIEMHTHMHCSASSNALQDVLTDSDALALLRATANVRAILHAGVTTMRDIGSKNAVAFTVREAVARGIIPGPRMLVSGAPITTTGGHFYFMGGEADTVEEVVAAFRTLVKLGADHVKMMVSGGGFTPGTNTRRSQYRLEHLRAAAGEARRLQKHFVAHCHATEAIAYAAEAGVDTIVHCSWQGEAGVHVDEGALKQIVEKGIYVDPTIAVGYRPLAQALTTGSELSPEMQAWHDQRSERLTIFRRMWEMGARFIVGTDSGMPNTPFGDWALTPELMVKELGLSPLQAIQAGTQVAAEALGRSREIGTVEPGKLADLTVVQGDPLADITALSDVDTVLVGGRVMKQAGVLRDV